MDNQLILDSINAITQWQDYGNEQVGKSNGGYFGKGGWSYEKLDRLRIQLEKLYKEQQQSEV